MKKFLALSLAAVLALGTLTGCGPKEPAPADPSAGVDANPEVKPVELNVVTTYAGNDGNAQNFADACAAWSTETGNTVADASATSDETFKARVITDFETGAEPDVLFYFNAFVEAGKVVSIDEIRKEYPDYASNMKDGMMGASPVDGKNYSVPVNGYWEGMFCNKTVLADCGIEVPGADYTWEQFMADCKTISDKGYAPIAAALANVPHYWFEYCIYNHLDTATHNILPVKEAGNAQYEAWLAGIGDMKAMYDAGCFPKNTLTGKDDDTFLAFTENKAAFLIDGSWKVGGIEAACGADAENNIPADPEKISNFTVTYIPGMGDRKTTDIIGGLSMGYYITKKAWDDPAKREAAVSFVEYMTTDETVSLFAAVSATALKNGSQVDQSKLSTLAQDGLKLVAGATGMAGA
ncbi:MAG: extracellular solute-binding protein, partial [Oscillospiraceae bacterium]